MEEKVKLTKLTTNAWHYRLIKFVWGNTLPDPKSIHNFCLYFWVLVATAIISIFVVPVKLLLNLNAYCYGKFWKWLDAKVAEETKVWAENLTDEAAYELYETYYWDSTIRRDNHKKDSEVKIPKSIDGKLTVFQVMQMWALKRGMDVNSPKYCDNLEKKLRKNKEKYQKAEKKKRNERNRLYQLEIEREERQRARDKRIRERMDSIASIFKPLKNLKPTIKFKNYAQIAKMGKRLMGVILTGVVAVITYGIVQCLTLLIGFIIKSWNGPVVGNFFLQVLYVLIGIIVIVAISYGITRIVRYAKERYQDHDEIVWYVKPFVWLALGLYTVGKYILYYPLYFIFVSFLWKLVCVGFFWGIIKGFGVAIAKFGGIFGEYFGASYTDYCPGINWDGKEDEEK